MTQDAVVALKGGLGNQLFQWAFGSALTAGGARVRYDGGLSMDSIGIDVRPLLADKDLVRLPSALLRAQRRFHLPAATSPWTHVVEPRFAYTDPASLLARGRTLLEGYWQSPRYFAPIEQVVRDAVLSWADSTLTDEGRTLRAEIEADPGACSVHVRRGDYLAATAQSVHGVLDADYYRRAMDEVRARGARRFHVFTNDHAWVADELLGADVVAVPWSVATSPVGEIGLMAACAHHVVANSSFSWWGAWLDDRERGTTIAPERWFADTALDTADLVPARWTRVAN